MSAGRRALVLGMTAVFLALAIHAFAGLTQPSLEPFALLACITGVALAWALTWRPLWLFFSALVTGPALGFVLARWDHARPGIDAASGLSIAHTADSLGPVAVAVTTALVFWISTLCGWQIGRWRQPWPVVALGATPILLRADLSHSYAVWFPAFIAGALAIVACTYLPSLRASASVVPAGLLCVAALVSAWHVPTAPNGWSLQFTDPLPSLAAGQGSNSLELSLSGKFRPGKGTVMTVQLGSTSLRPYWRTMVFDHFDGHAWTATQPAVTTVGADQSLSRYNDSLFGRLVDADVRVVEPTNTLIFPGRPRLTSLTTHVAYSQYSSEPASIQSTKMLSAGQDYQVEGLFQPSGVGTPSHASGADLSPYLQVPSGEPVGVRNLAQTLERDRPDPVQAAFNIQNYLRTRFQYDPNAGAAPDEDAISQFLFRTKRGYCTQFASAMVILARDAGIPARLVSGYATGSYHNGVFTVREADGHSWPELYFQQYGWVPFEPTPGYALDPSIAMSHHDGTGGTQTNTVASQAGLKAQYQGVGLKNAYLKLHNPAKPHQTSRGHSSPNVLVGLLAIVVLLLVLSLYSLRPRSLASMYAALVRGGGGTRSIRDGETPAEFLRRFERDSGSYADAATIVNLYTRQRYAGRAATAAELRQARASWKRLRRRNLSGPVRLVAGFSAPIR